MAEQNYLLLTIFFVAAIGTIWFLEVKVSPILEMIFNPKKEEKE